MVCKCDKKSNAMKLQSNSSINSTVLENVGFNAEVVTIRNGKKTKRVLSTYDSFASQTNLNYTVKDELELDTAYT